MDSIVQGNNLIAIQLHKALAKSDTNTFFSPFSISSVLTMLLHGLRGDAESEVRKFLAYENIDRDALANAFETVISSLSNCPHGYTISYANSLVIDQHFEVFDKYKLDLDKFFKALVVQADFHDNPIAAKDQINKWVKDKTNGMIPELLSSLSPMTDMVLLNAIYFKGFWLKQFSEKTTVKQEFYNRGTTSKEIEMMRQKKSFNWVRRKSFSALQLPYKGEEIAMIVFLPTSRNGLKEVEDLMTPSFILEVSKDMHSVRIDVALPKFRLEYGDGIRETLQELGIKGIFNFGSDFGGINDSRDLAVSQFIHKAVLEVNEEGCEAAAASAAVVAYCIRGDRKAPTPEFIVDHPFAFVIYNMENDLVLFMGRVIEL